MDDIAAALKQYEDDASGAIAYLLGALVAYRTAASVVLSTEPAEARNAVTTNLRLALLAKAPAAAYSHGYRDALAKLESLPSQEPPDPS